MGSFFESEFMLSNSLHFVLLTSALVLAFHLPIWCGFNLCKRRWKYIDYLWPLLAGIGMLGAVSEIRSVVAGNWAATEQTRAVTTLESIHDFSVRQIRGDMCSGITSVSGEDIYSDPCRWYLSIAKQLKSLDFSSLPQVSRRSFPTDGLSLEWIEDDVVWVKGMLEQYNQQKNQYNKTISAQVKHPMEQVFWYISPYLVCFAVALRLAKVTGELKLEKQT
ncbi:hypothetical protein [Vibrio sp. 99-8-1]|uniref:hypothetical protein n=1 Tax=Vibrio sp. 99-8-1 TaxID=2607602 RepID=UPI0014939A9D|nr:hypothetical protein [Vibrio sp. 99-8-1]NOI67435.1 hypothetical protein [Vibrio sp. 99-8-1]